MMEKILNKINVGWFTIDPNVHISSQVNVATKKWPSSVYLCWCRRWFEMQISVDKPPDLNCNFYLQNPSDPQKRRRKRERERERERERFSLASLSQTWELPFFTLMERSTEDGWWIVSCVDCMLDTPGYREFCLLLLRSCVDCTPRFRKMRED
jgi:hypothetical protein